MILAEISCNYFQGVGGETIRGVMMYVGEAMEEDGLICGRGVIVI